MKKYAYNLKTKELIELGLPAHTGAHDGYYLGEYLLLVEETELHQLRHRLQAIEFYLKLVEAGAPFDIEKALQLLGI